MLFFLCKLNMSWTLGGSCFVRFLIRIFQRCVSLWNRNRHRHRYIIKRMDNLLSCLSAWFQLWISYPRVTPKYSKISKPKQKQKELLKMPSDTRIFFLFRITDCITNYASHHEPATAIGMRICIRILLTTAVNFHFEMWNLSLSTDQFVAETTENKAQRIENSSSMCARAMKQIPKLMSIMVFSASENSFASHQTQISQRYFIKNATKALAGFFLIFKNNYRKIK